MRPLTEEETQAVFKKLAEYTGASLKNIIAPQEDGDRNVFRLSQNRVYLELAWVCKFTKSGKFRIHITALPILAEHARHKLWIRPNGVMPFLYGGNVVKAHVGRYSEDCPEHQGLVIYTMDDVPLGFGVSARSTAESRRLDPTGVVCFRQADCGEYLRDEDTLFQSG
ncbi:hypothetical protein THARTR1_03809 [Trichoderma harzianum]|uniref:60S ribosome subunit biogenesis protein NIP7 n=1 Tax=Trichoderma harzianum TaxID=5544 RepID=A0A2K0UEQ9_TRIHA|nr:hypothetical protein THARTR1_03809 [Trichoderma harzianum]